MTIACVGTRFSEPHRDEWLVQLADSRLQRRQLRCEARQDLILECRKYSETKLLRTVPWQGPIRVGLLLGRVQTPHRLRSKRQFCACRCDAETAPP